MVIIRVDGTREERHSPLCWTVEELISVLGGPWSVVGRIAYSGEACFVLALTRAFELGLRKNEVVSRLCGKIVWGDAVVVVRGREI